jgi:ubiquinone/menaquinone biosynthesis C-methylase UbiE
MMWLLLLSLLCIYLIRCHIWGRYYNHQTVTNTYNVEYSELYDTVWYDEDRYKAEVEYISQNMDGKEPISILDLGCGTGNHIEMWKKLWPDSDVTGLDLSHGQLSKARMKHPLVNFVQGSYLDRNVLGNNKFDMIACMYGAGQYTDETHILIQNVYEWLKPGGVFIFHGIDSTRLCDGCEQTASNTSLPIRSDAKGHCNVLYPTLIYSSWWSTSNFSNWVRYNETFYKIHGNEWPLDWDVSKKTNENVPLGITKSGNLIRNGHSLYLLPPSRIMEIGRNIGFTNVYKNPTKGIVGIHDQGSEEYFIFFEK